MNWTTSHTLYATDPETGDPVEILFNAHWTLRGEHSYFGPYFDLDYCRPINVPIFLTIEHLRKMEEIANDDPPDPGDAELAYDDWRYHNDREDPDSLYYPRDED